MKYYAGHNNSPLSTPLLAVCGAAQIPLAFLLFQDSCSRWDEVDSQRTVVAFPRGSHTEFLVCPQGIPRDVSVQGAVGSQGSSPALHQGPSSLHPCRLRGSTPAKVCSLLHIHVEAISKALHSAVAVFPDLASLPLPRILCHPLWVSSLLSFLSPPTPTLAELLSHSGAPGCLLLL